MNERKPDWAFRALGAAFFLIVILFVLGTMLLHSKLVYHNYRCAFAHCRIINGEVTTR